MSELLSYSVVTRIHTPVSFSRIGTWLAWLEASCAETQLGASMTN